MGKHIFRKVYMSGSGQPAQAAGRHLEETQSLRQIVACLAATTDDRERQNVRVDPNTISKQIGDYKNRAHIALIEA